MVVMVVAEMTTNRFVADVTFLLKPHMASMLHLHRVFLTAVTQALCTRAGFQMTEGRHGGNQKSGGASPP